MGVTQGITAYGSALVAALTDRGLSAQRRSRPRHEWDYGRARATNGAPAPHAQGAVRPQIPVNAVGGSDPRVEVTGLRHQVGRVENNILPSAPCDLLGYQWSWC